MPDDKPVTIGNLLERLGVGLLLTWFLTRVFVVSAPGSDTGDPAANLFIGLLAWIGGGAYIAGRALTDGWTARWRAGLALLFVLALVMPLPLLTESVEASERRVYAMSALEGMFAFMTAFLAFALVVDQCGRGWRRFWLAAFFGVGAVAIVYALVQVAYIFPMLRETGAAVGRGEEFEERVRLGEPIGTFLLSNTFAGFLALFLPILAGRILDRQGRPGVREIVLGAIGLLALGLLWKTGSRGGALAMAAAAASMIVLMAGRARKWQPAATLQYGLIAAALAGAGMALWGWKPLTERVDTMRYRSEYWSAAWRMVRAKPWLGVGIYQYGERYPEERGQSTEETLQVHNDYLQVAAETGVFGFAAFLLFLGWLLWNALQAMRPEEVGARDPPLATGMLLGLALAGFAGFALANLSAGAFNDVEVGGRTTPLLAVGLLGVFVGAAALAGGADGPMTRLGWAAGLIGYLVHATVDFDLFTYGFMACFFVMAAVGAAWGPLRELVVGKAPALLLSVALLMLSLLLMATRVPEWTQVQRAIEDARDAASSAADMENPIQRVERLTEAAMGLRRASEIETRDARVCALQAEVLWELWRARFALPGLTATQLGELEGHLMEAFEAAQQGAARRPASAEMRFRIAYSHMMMAENSARAAGLPGISANDANEARASIEGSALGAMIGFEEAIDLNPMSARYHYWRARALLLQVQVNPERRVALEDAQRSYQRARQIAESARLERQRQYWLPDPEDRLVGLLPGDRDE